MRSQPNFCSLAAQAEALLQKFMKGNFPPYNVFVLVSKSVPPNIRVGPQSYAYILYLLYDVSEGATNVSPVQVNLEQDEEGTGDEDSGYENSLYQGGIMDFSAPAIAEELTRIDSVCKEISWYSYISVV